MTNLAARIARVERQHGARPSPDDLTFAALVLLADRQEAAARQGRDPDPADATLWAAFQADPRWGPALAGAQERLDAWEQAHAWPVLEGA